VWQAEQGGLSGQEMERQPELEDAALGDAVLQELSADLLGAALLLVQIVASVERIRWNHEELGS
jgi:hypothetical protein